MITNADRAIKVRKKIIKYFFSLKLNIKHSALVQTNSFGWKFIFWLFYKSCSWMSYKMQLQLSKVKLFWEGHKNLHILPQGFDIYLVDVKTMKKIVEIFVAFSEKLNFKQNNVRCWPKFLANYQHKCNYYLDLHEAVLYLSRLTILWVVCMKASVEQCLS